MNAEDKQMADDEATRFFAQLGQSFSNLEQQLSTPIRAEIAKRLQVIFGDGMAERQASLIAEFDFTDRLKAMLTAEEATKTEA